MFGEIGAHVIKKLIDQHWPWSKENIAKETKTEIYEQVRRFKRELIAHGLKPAYWPEFFETCKAPFSIKHSDLKSDETLLDWFDNEKLSWVCETLLIDRDWLNGEGYGPHRHFNFGIDPQKMVETLKAESENYPLEASHHRDAIFVINSQSEHALTNTSTCVSMAYGIPICRLGNEILVTRWVVDDGAGGYPWLDHRYQSFIRMYARLAHKAFGMYTTWELLKNKDFEAFQKGELMVPEVLEKSTRFRANTQPEDYGLLECESAVAKGADSLPPIMDFMKNQGLPAAFPEPLFATSSHNQSK